MARTVTLRTRHAVLACLVTVGLGSLMAAEERYAVWWNPTLELGKLAGVAARMQRAEVILGDEPFVPLSKGPFNQPACVLCSRRDRVAKQGACSFSTGNLG